MKQPRTEIRMRIRKVKNGYIAMFGGLEWGLVEDEFIGRTPAQVRAAALQELTRQLDEVIEGVK